MKKLARGARKAVRIIAAGITHYWITLAVGTLLQAAAIMLAAAERGYYAVGSELCVLPIVFTIGYYLTPVLKAESTDEGLKFRTEKHRA